MNVETRLRRLEAKEAIRELRYKYAWAVDAGDVDRFLDLFTTEAEIRFPQEAADRLPVSGRDELAEFVRTIDNTLRFSAHMLHNPTITVDGDEARGTWYVDVPEVTADGAVWVQGRYEDEYRRTEDGWKFTSIEISYNYRASPAEGWRLEDIEAWE
jgi:ketosteroid isomerase-like protein